MRARLLIFSLALAFVALPAWAHAPDSRSVPLEGTRVRLQHRSTQEVIAFFSRPALPDGVPPPRSARAGTPDSLLPAGVEAILRGDDGEVVLVGAGASCTALAELLRRLDQIVTAVASGDVETRIRTGASARDVARQIRSLPGGGTVKVEGSELRLTGSREWLFRALRVAIQAETKPTAKTEGVL